MDRRRREDMAVTVACFGISGIALAFGLWIAAAPLGGAADFWASSPLIFVEAE